MSFVKADRRKSPGLPHSKGIWGLSTCILAHSSFAFLYFSVSSGAHLVLLPWSPLLFNMQRMVRSDRDMILNGFFDSSSTIHTILLMNLGCNSPSVHILEGWLIFCKKIGNRGHRNTKPLEIVLTFNICNLLAELCRQLSPLLSLVNVQYVAYSDT